MPVLMRAVSRVEGPGHWAANVSVPSGPKARFRAKAAAIRLVRELAATSRAASAQEQEVLAGFSGWGAIQDVFSERPIAAS